MDNSHIEIDPAIPNTAVSIYGNGDAMDDFPVLKAFQQYIDAEHAKARKRLISLGIFFGIFTGVIISIFVILLVNVSSRNQALNDRLIEFAMKDRDRGQQAAVVVQPPIQQDNSALMALAAKFEDLQKKLTEKESAEDKKENTKAEAQKEKSPSAAELEVVRLKALLSAEKEKLAEEKKRQKELELEAYRRKYYPELYEAKAEKKESTAVKKRPSRRKIADVDIDEEDIEDDELDDIDLDADTAIKYFDDETQDVEEAKTAPRKYYSIPVEVHGKKSNWQIPND
jgi:hypothetical protein